MSDTGCFLAEKVAWEPDKVAILVIMVISKPIVQILYVYTESCYQADYQTSANFSPALIISGKTKGQSQGLTLLLTANVTCWTKSIHFC